MPPSIPINTGGQIRSGEGFIIALTPDNPNRYIRVVVSYEEGSLSLQFTPPGGVTALRMIGFNGKSVADKPVTPNVATSVTYEREDLTDGNENYFRVMFGAANGRLRGLDLNFPPDEENPGANPVRLISNGSLSTSDVAGSPMTATAARFAGDIEDLNSFLETSDNEGASVVDRGAIPATTPSVVGRWFRGVWGALGPNEDEPPTTEWLYYRTEWRTVVAASGVPDLLAEDVVIDRSVFRPTGQNTNFTPIMRFPGLAGRAVETIQFTADQGTPTWHRVTARPGEAGAYDLFDNDHPVAAGAFDNAIFKNDARATGNRLRFRYRQTATGIWSDPSPGMDVPLPATPVQPGGRAIFLPTQAESADALNNTFQTYSTGVNTQYLHEGAGANNNDSIHSPVVTALEAWAYDGIAGAPRTYTSGQWQGAQTARDRLIGQLKLWGNAAETAPCGRASYAAQYSLAFSATVAIARAIPNVWSALTDIERTRLDLCMQGEFFGNLYVQSDGHPKPWTYQNMRSIRGYSGARDNAPNYTVPMKLIPHLYVAYLRAAGVANPPAAAQTLLNNFDRDEYASQVQAAGGLVGMWETFRRQWTTAVQNEMHTGSHQPVGPGPDKALLHAVLKYKVNGEMVFAGGRLSDTADNLQAQMARFAGGTISPGVTGEPGGEVHDGLPTAYGIKHPSTGGELRGCIYDTTRWAEQPNRGQSGQATELNTTDGNGRRSSMMYSQRGGLSMWCAMGAFVAVSGINRNDDGWIASAQRMNRCITDLQYRDEHGHWDYTKGGNSATTTNALYNRAFANGRGLKLPSRYAMVRIFNRWATTETTPDPDPGPDPEPDPLAIGTAPTFVARVPPGTADGSIWDINPGSVTGGTPPYQSARQVFRGTVAVAPFNANTNTYTVDRPADDGRTIRADQRWIDSGTPPQQIIRRAAQSLVVPGTDPGPDPVVDRTVSTTAQLIAAMVDAADLTGPRVILCDEGDYSALTLTRAIRNELHKVGWAWVNYPGGSGGQRRYELNTDFVTIKARGPGCRFLNAPVRLENVWGFIFDGWTFQSNQTRTGGFPATAAVGIYGMDLRNFYVRNCRFVNLHQGVKLLQRAFDGGPYGHNKFTVQPNIAGGGRVGDGTGFNIEVVNCEFTGISMHAIYTASDVIVRQRFFNNRINNWNGDTGLVYTGPPDSRPTGIMTQGKWNEEWHVAENYIVGPNNGTPFTGIHLRNRWSGQDYNFANIISAHGPEILIEDNTVLQRSANGITVEATTGMIIRDNRLRALAGGALPGIQLDPEIRDTTISNNIVARATNNPARSNFTQSGTTINAATTTEAALPPLFPVGPA